MICARKGLRKFKYKDKHKDKYNDKDKYKNIGQPMMLYVFGKEMTKGV